MHGGAFHPLSWYEEQGYDVARIEALTDEEDKLEDPVRGTCYRVYIEAVECMVLDEIAKNKFRI